MRYSVVGSTAEQIRAAGGKDVKVVRSADIVFAELTVSQVSVLKSMGAAVFSVGKVKTAIRAPTLPVSAEVPHTVDELAEVLGIEQVRAAASSPPYGVGFIVAVVGTGIRASHELIQRRVIYSKNYTKDAVGDGYDHDTGVASIIVGTMPGCSILDIKVLDNDGDGDEEAVVEAIDDLIDMYDRDSELTPHVINLSFGATDMDDPGEPMRVICREAVRRNMYVFASAGNGGPEEQTIASPACEKYVFAVGSARYDPFSVSDFSSRGPTKEGLVKPDVLFFGENVVVASSRGDSAISVSSGTSFACPFASASAIMLLEVTRAPDLLPPSIEYIMDSRLSRACVKPEGVATGKDDVYGNGVPIGPLALNGSVPRPATVDVSTLPSLFIAMAMMGMVARSAR